MSQQQHTQEPVAWQSTKDKQFVTADKKKAKMWECSGYVLTPLYVFPPDASARIAELEGQVEMLLAALENCRLLAARRRKEEWAGHVLRFCGEAGVAGEVMR